MNINMRNLQDFQVPNDGELVLCEIDGRVKSMNVQFHNVNTFTSTVASHPKVNITRDLLHYAGTSDEGRELFLPVNVSFLKQLLQIYYEHGLVKVVRAISNHHNLVFSTSASLVLKMIGGFELVKDKLNLQPHDCGPGLINSISATRSWSNSAIRCIAWHPYHTKIAVATLDDTVRIYFSDTNSTILLKCKQQRNVCCLAWRPLCNLEIAVGCENGIFVWHLDPNSVVTRPSVNNATILHRLKHKPICSLAWSPRGDIMVSAAAGDASILVWDVEFDNTSSLKRPGSVGNTLVKWSPSGSQMFSAGLGVVFRIWECHTWQSERWNILSGRVQAACWSPCGSVLLFTTTKEPVLYALSFTKSDLVFSKNSTNSPNQAIPVYDLTTVDIDGVIVGGIVRNMDWDPNGHHLAVLFKDTNHVAIFNVVVQTVLQISAGTLVSGTPEELPNTIEFQKNFAHGACLSIGWSSGRLQHFPIVYSDMVSNANRVLRN